MDFTSEVLHHIGQNNSNTFVVQIGAMDGISFDDTRGFLDLYKWDALLVEPIPELMDELKENFKDKTNYIYEQSAITGFDGVTNMLMVPPDVVVKENLHPGYKGMSGLYPLKNGFGSDYERDIRVKNDFGVNVEVPCITLKTLLDKHNIEKIDIFLCDVEGYDWDVFKQFDFSRFDPIYIKLEYVNLNDNEKKLIREKLESNGYKTYADFDIIAVKESYWNKMKGIKDETYPIHYYIQKYGSDKNISNYTTIYENLFSTEKENFNSILEIGVGTLDPSIPSSYCGIKGINEHYSPGGSLRAWRDYFKNAMVYGIDVAEDCRIEEERIKTFIFSSLDTDKCNNELNDLTFDVIFDDGLHDADAQYKTLTNLFKRVKDNGYYIIEDLVGGVGRLFVDKKVEFDEFVKEHEYYYGGNFVIIRKNYSGNGQISTFPEFSGRPYVSEFPFTPPELYSSVPLNNEKFKVNKDLTIVTGLWNIGRPGRDFDHYIACFKKFLEIPNNLFIYIPEEYEHIVWEIRSKENTYVKIAGLDYIKNLYDPFWEKTQEIRTDPKWFNSTGENGWLKNSPQAVLEWYNPIVQSKMFLLNDATIWNPFDTEYFIWLDAGITNTVNSYHLTNQRALDKILPYLDSFLFLSYPYETQTEIHGFEINGMNRYAGSPVKYVCRGGLFGGKKEVINQANSTYYATLQQSLEEGFMGTEESVFSIMSYKEPNIYDRYALDGNGLIVKFTEALINDTVKLEDPPKKKTQISVTRRELNKVKTNSYILTFNFPKQLLHTIESMKKVPEWLEKPHLVLIDNSTDVGARAENVKIAEEYNMEYIPMERNTGICGGRQKAAEHFHDSDADYMFFFEDDMTINSEELKGELCRNGFRKYIPNAYDLVHKIMIKENFDFLKMSFTEVYFDNEICLPWYNVPQHIRTRDWPNYDKLPVTGLDPNAPHTTFEHIYFMDGVGYITGNINYCNWPMIVSKEGNKKMFIDTKWVHPYEQTWSSHIYQITKEGKINSALLLASPIWHDRILWYKPEERREN